VLHTRCYLEVATGRRKAALNTLKQARQVPLKGEFFEIEHLLTESRINEATKDFSRRLQESIVVTQRLGTLYQECQLLLALARVSLSLHDITEANRVARRARRLCGMRGYRLLEAEALLLVGLSSKRRLEKEFFLSRSLNESSQLGLIPLAAECAFSIGSWEFQIGHLGAASEYLAKSVSITSRIAETLTAKHRKSYLDLPNHRAARDLLKRATKGTPVTLEFPGLRQKEHSFFADLYRLVVAMNTSPEVDSATKRLLEGLKSSLDYPVTVVVGLGAAPGFHSLPPTVSEQKKQQILSTAAIAGNRTYISGSGPHQRKKTTVWVPLLSLTQPGGLYMECPGHRYAPEERQIEFLTLVGTVAGAVLDGFAARTTVVAHPSSSVQNGVVGASKQLGEIHQQVEIAATNDANVLIEGESGTGKELVARAIHSQSTRSKGPFVAVDCGALPEALIESELFGAKRGSYTGSLSDRVGLFETAHKGTIFLDEISNLGVAAQAKLLRVLQDREVRQIGSTTTKFVDVRLIAATNCNLEKLVHQDRFRKDLLYRLKVLYIVIPPLRERKSDIPVLATTFLGRLNIRNQTQKYFGPMVMPKLTASSYPGNVRELQNVVERAFYSTRGPVITQIAFLEDGFQHSSSSDVEDWFRDLTEGRQDFWREVHDRYKRRDIPRERVVALVDYGLRITHGSYKSMASKFQISKEEYRRFMDFLRRSKCLLDFRPYRRMSDGHDSL
jgi:DNA-binding NtrC family response regulator